MSTSRRRSTAVIAATTLIVAGLGAAVAGPGQAVTSGVAPAAKAAKAKPAKALTDNAVFFASDGLRQDLVKKYADQGLMPTMRSFLRNGVSAADDGLLTQAPPNTGAGWYTLATGAWPGVHGSTNNTFHKNGDAFGATAPPPSTPACCRPSRSRRPPSAAASRSPRSSGPADATRRSTGRRSTSGPSTPAAVSRRTSSAGRRRLFDDPAFIAAFGLQFDHPAGFAGQAPFPQAAPTPATGWTNVPTSYSPAMEMRLRVLDCRRRQVRPQRLPLRQHQRRHHQLRPGAVLDDQGRRRRRRRRGRGRVGRRQGDDLRRHARRQDRRHAGPGRGDVGRPVPGPVVPHLGDPGHRELADLARRGGLHRVRRVPGHRVPDVDGCRLRRPRGRHRQRADVRRPGPRTGPPATGR